MEEQTIKQIKCDTCAQVLESIRNVLIEKNKRYGNSALSPLGVFYKGDAANSIRIRLDDKLSRIKNSEVLRKNDLYDLLGYCMLYVINEKYGTNVEEGSKTFIEKFSAAHFSAANFGFVLHGLGGCADTNEFSYQGFLKDGNTDNIIVKCLNGICSEIKDDEDVILSKVELLIYYLVVYFTDNNITDFSDLID